MLCPISPSVPNWSFAQCPLYGLQTPSPAFLPMFHFPPPLPLSQGCPAGNLRQDHLGAGEGGGRRREKGLEREGPDVPKWVSSATI